MSLDDNQPRNFKAPPLTTTFTPPSSCLDPPHAPTIGPDGYIYWQFHPLSFEGDWTSCYPQNFRSAWQSGLDVYYSPGVCPKGYTANLSNVGDETRGLCCMSGWSTHTDWKDYCYRTLSREIWAPGVSIRWKQQDVTLFSGPTASGSGPSPTNTPEPGVTTGLPRPTGVVVENEGGMAKTAKIGLGVGIPVALLIIALACSFFWVKRKEERKSKAQTSDPEWPSAYKTEGKPSISPEATLINPSSNGHGGFYAPTQIKPSLQPQGPQFSELDSTQVTPVAKPAVQPYYAPPPNSYNQTPAAPYPTYHPGSPAPTLVQGPTPPSAPTHYQYAPVNELDSTPVASNLPKKSV